MAIWSSLLMVLVLIGVAFLGIEVGGLDYFFGVIIPYVAIVALIVGFCYRVILWALSPIPFRIPLTGGQQKSLKWIKDNKFDNPSTLAGVIGRMLGEIFFFRSLFRNVKADLHEGGKLSYRREKWLWLFGLVFHWSLLIIIIRHLGLFTEPVPKLVGWMESLDGLFYFGYHAFFITDVCIILGVTFLFLRRVMIHQVKYISLPGDYFPLMLIGSVAITGILMRYIFKVDVTSIKELSTGLVSFAFTVPKDINVLFYIHLFLVSTLIAYLPFSKLMHAGGILMSPTRNLANTSRSIRHINPWNYPVDVHTYEEYEDEFREKMVAVGISVEKG